MSRVLTFARVAARNRLVHFLVLGGVLFAIAPEQPSDPARIRIDGQKAERALTRARAEAGRPLDRRETRAVLDALVEREVLAREAVRLGVVPEDEETTTRLADALAAKLAIGAGDAPSSREVDAEAETLAALAPERVTIDVVFVATTRDDARARAEDARARLDRGETPVVDTPPVASHGTWTAASLARATSPAVAAAAYATALGRASEPVAASWGFFVVRLVERSRPGPNELRGEAIRALAERARRDRGQAVARRAADRYDVRVELPPGEDVDGSRGPWRLSGPAAGEPVD